MKICQSCHTMYDDSEKYCYSCGTVLIEQSNDSNVQDSKTEESGQGSTSGITPYIPIIMVVAGMVIGWYISGLFGGVMGITAVCSVLKDKTGTFKFKPFVWIGAVFCIIFCILAAFA